MQDKSLAAINSFLDELKKDNELKNDAHLCRELGIFPPVLSKVRSGMLNFGPMMILAVHERFGIKVAKIRQLTGAKK
jgi:hypothetical protein